jgi:hypothetical protein
MRYYRKRAGRSMARGAGFLFLNNRNPLVYRHLQEGLSELSVLNAVYPYGLDHGAGHFRPLRIISEVLEPLIISVVRSFCMAQQ